MIQFNVFPGGKRRAATFSYDDGSKTDERLIEMFNRHGMKATFHCNNRIQRKGDKPEDIVYLRELYAGHELSCHTKTHNNPNVMSRESILRETLDNRRFLEKIAQYPVLGMSYPFGAFDDRSIEIMKSCGIVYGRTIRNGGLGFPKDFMRWDPTCHHFDAKKYADALISEIDEHDGWADRGLLYIWGHSNDFASEAEWQEFEDVLKSLEDYGDKIWFATNIEYYDYVQAQHSLVVSVDESSVYNPTSINVWVEKAVLYDHHTVCVKAGQTVRI